MSLMEMPEHRKPQSRIVPSAECHVRLEQFGARLQSLCDEFGFTFYANPDSADLISIEDRRRKARKKELDDFPYVAHFEGVDKRGVYNRCNPTRRRVVGFDLGEYDDDFMEHGS